MAAKRASNQLTDKEQVAAHIQQLEPEIGIIVTKVSEIILDTDGMIAERIKWNNPSFY